MKYQLTKSLLLNYYQTLYQHLNTGTDRITPRKFNLIKEDEFNLILKKVNKRSYNFSSLKKITLSTNREVYVPTIRDRLVLEYLKDRLQHKYRISYTDRENIIKSILLKFNSEMDYYVIRLDIKQFFNSIPQNLLLNNIKEKSLLSSHEYYILKEFLKKVKDGLPQGVSISNVLSEIYMEHFDREFKQIHSRINYYCRFVDDILIIINGNLSKTQITLIEEKCKSIFKKYLLEVNDDENKYKFTIFPLNNKKYKDEYNFSYLGYKFICQDNKLTVTVLQDKIDKLKSKILFCFEEFKKNRNLELLIHRLDFLTKKNAVIKKEKFISNNLRLKFRKKKICFSFMESYKLIDETQKLIIAREIDQLLRTEINQIKNILNSKVIGFKYKDKKRLYSISFSRNMDAFNAIYRYKKSDYINKINLFNPSLRSNQLQLLTYIELSKIYFNYIGLDK